MPRPYGRHLNDLPFQELQPVIFMKDARFRHPMVILHGKPIGNQLDSHPPTRDYVERRTKEGLSKPEIVRCLKRYVARETYALLPRELLD